MAHGTNALLVGARRGTPAAVPGGSWHPRGAWLLAAVAGAFTLAQLLLVRPGLGIGWDEAVYISQNSAQAPPAFFSAPRARGVSLLVAPITTWSTSGELLRVYLALLSGLALYLALRVWRGLFPARVLAAAGALFATLWITLFYGPAAMPNYWVAIGALTCVGCCLRAYADHRDRAALWGVAAGGALMAWMRPTDAVWTSLPLLVLVAAGRRLRLALVFLAGLATGIGQWVIEAFLSHGGPLERLAEGSRIQGGLGWHFAVDDQLRSLAGRGLCRPCTGSLPHPAVMTWWFVLPVLAAVGLVIAIRAGRTLPTLLLLACATTAALPYLFLIGYAAPRFLQPAYLLLAIPVADALFHLVTGTNGRWRPAAAALVALGLAGHLAVQYAVLDRLVDRTAAGRGDWSRVAADLHRQGVRPPCRLTGVDAVPIAFYTGCRSVNPRGHNANTTVEGIVDTARRIPTAVLTRPGVAPPAYARGWERHPSARLDLHVAPLAPGNGPA
ncbi:hypothetical protein [Streptomyces sp. A012304]|uniref:hypothetical protein n=1 Tax=Streptomyces sp. A012304 TaxID=375446 RepID=UPI00222E12C0|nr:hypothetical protein [Streptomyces sp. A012304]GKQ34972.1 hypothetical protein ALMP_15190 [Streptomyces sp. A012304]